MSLIETARRYLVRGWAPIPIPFRKKAPAILKWQLLRVSEETLTEHFPGSPQNVGVLLGEASKGLMDIDLDCDEAIRVADHFLPRTGCEFGRPSRRRSHRLYMCTGNLKTEQFQDTDGSMIVELRGNGAQTVFPGSVHESGEPIEWDRDETPHGVADDEELRVSVRQLACAAILVRHWPAEGSRQDAAIALAGGLFRSRAIPPDEISDFVALVAETAGDDEVDSRRDGAECTINKLLAGGEKAKVTGWPRLAKLLGTEVVDRLRRWLCPEPFAQTKTGDVEEGDTATTLPDVLLPGGSTSITRAAKQLGGLLAATGIYFLWGGAVAKLIRSVNGHPEMLPVTPVQLCSIFETVASLKRPGPKDNIVDAVCSESTAKQILYAEGFTSALPVVRVVTRCAVLVDRDGALIPITGFDALSGVMAAGDAVEEVSVEVARDLLFDLVADFRFVTPSDRSRALASIITPALVMGGLLGARVPIDLTEANESQTGKGFRNKLTAAIYGHTVTPVTQKKGGVGSMDETFNHALIKGCVFVSLDNIRGKIDSPAIESFMTEDAYIARVPYVPNVEIDPSRFIVMFTSNRAEITPDLANRSSIVRIIKQPGNYEFRTYPEGDILDHVRARRALYLGAVFSIVRAWYAAGRAATNQTQHDFRRWARVMDWIVQNILEAAPLLGDHRTVQLRMASPDLNWLRDVTLAIVRRGMTDTWLRGSQIFDVLRTEGVEVPGLGDGDDPEDGDTRMKAFRAIGQRLSRCFGGREQQAIDSQVVERREATDRDGRKHNEYRFHGVAEPESGKEGAETAKPTISAIDENASPNRKPPFPQSPPIPPMVFNPVLPALPEGGVDEARYGDVENDCGDSGRLGEATEMPVSCERGETASIASVAPDYTPLHDERQTEEL